MFSLVYIHIGKSIPNYLYDSLYQSLLINGSSCKIFVVIDDTQIPSFRSIIENFNLEIYNNSTTANVTIIPVSLLEDYTSSDFTSYKLTLSRFNNIDSFRDGFWVSTTSRFFYIEALMKCLRIENVFHIENDVMLYESFDNIQKCVPYAAQKTVWMVQDAPDRVVPSLLYFPSLDLIKNVNAFIVKTLSSSNVFMNDMNILGLYKDKFELAIFPNSKLMFDGAAIGQFLGGIDKRNEPKSSTIGFVNETSKFKPDTCIFSRNVIKTDEHYTSIKLFNCTYLSKDDFYITPIANLHIHTKNLHEFSSVFDIKHEDIITGDRVLSLCDFVICTDEIMRFHNGIEKFANDIIKVRKWESIDFVAFNGFLKASSIKKGTRNLSLFVYTHILDKFVKHMLPSLDPYYRYTIYTHNSDHSFDESFSDLIKDSKIERVFAQNIDYADTSEKLSMLPIGIANSMWKHGDLSMLYSTMKATYYKRKTKDMYVNVNPATFAYRQNILDVVKKCFQISTCKPYSDYLKELSEYRFCLCTRGNGIDSHRLWESLYLGVIPVVIDNEMTKISHFVRYIRSMGVPIVVIKLDNLDKIVDLYDSDYFSQVRYNQIIQATGKPIQNNDFLKMSYYKV